MEASEAQTQELVMMYLARAGKQVEAIQKRIDAGERVPDAERIDALTVLAESLTACLTIVAARVDELGT